MEATHSSTSGFLSASYILLILTHLRTRQSWVFLGSVPHNPSTTSLSFLTLCSTESEFLSVPGLNRCEYQPCVPQGLCPLLKLTHLLVLCPLPITRTPRHAQKQDKPAQRLLHLPEEEEKKYSWYLQGSCFSINWE